MLGFDVGFCLIGLIPEFLALPCHSRPLRHWLCTSLPCWHHWSNAFTIIVWLSSTGYICPWHTAAADYRATCWVLWRLWPVRYLGNRCAIHRLLSLGSHRIIVGKWVCVPESPTWNKIYELIWTLYRQNGSTIQYAKYKIQLQNIQVRLYRKSYRKLYKKSKLVCIYVYEKLWKGVWVVLTISLQMA